MTRAQRGLIVAQVALLSSACGVRPIGSCDSGFVDLSAERGADSDTVEDAIDSPAAAEDSGADGAEDRIVSVEDGAIDSSDDSASDYPMDVEQDVPDARPEIAAIDASDGDTAQPDAGSDLVPPPPPPVRPTQVAAWEPPLAEPSSGATRITIITESMLTRGMTFAGTTAGDVYRAFDGETDTPAWEKVDDFYTGSPSFQMPNLPVSGLLIAPYDSRHVWTAFTGSEGIGHKVWVTSLGGRTWRELTGSPLDNIVSLSMNPLDDYVLYAVTSSRIVRSTDSGESWEWWTPDTRDPHLNGDHITAVASAFGTRRIWTADRTGAIWASNAPDPSQTGAPRIWTSVSAMTPARTVNSLTVVVDAEGEHVAMACESVASDGVWLSDDGGQTWRNGHGKGLPANASIFTVSFNPHYHSTIYAFTSAGAYRSDDRGTTWW